jgi:exodeoxyribonuclease VII small subunit
MTKEKPFNFEESMEKLEEIVKSLESENQSLEKNIQLFEQGLTISKELKTHLDSAEKKIEILSKDIDGNLSLDEFKEE